jgi:hypothetical protein
MSTFERIRSAMGPGHLDQESTSGLGSLPPAVAISRGILHCRRGEWHSALHYLRLVGQQDGDATMPGLYWSHLGLALARCERRFDEAIALCERAVETEFFDPENFQNLAWVRLLAGDRLGAVRAIERGRMLDSHHPGWRDLMTRVGVRRPPVVRFLRRDHPLNRKLGKWRHAWESRQAG